MDDFIMVRSASHQAVDELDDGIAHRVETCGSDRLSTNVEAESETGKVLSAQRNVLRDKLLAWRTSSQRSIKSLGRKRSKADLDDGSVRSPSLEIKRHQSLSKLAGMLRISTRVKSTNDKGVAPHKVSGGMSENPFPFDTKYNLADVTKGEFVASDNPLFSQSNRA